MSNPKTLSRQPRSNRSHLRVRSGLDRNRGIPQPLNHINRKENQMRNTDPFAPWNATEFRHDPFAPHNDIMKRDDPFKPWNSPFGQEDELDPDERNYYRR